MSSLPAPVVTVRHLSKKFCARLRPALWYALRDMAAEVLPWRHPAARLRPHEFWSLQNLSFELRPGEALAIIGDNGAGKSTLLKLLHGLIRPDAGHIGLRGRVGALIELGVGLDPVLTGRENIFVRAALLGVGRTQAQALLPAIVEFTGLGEAIEMPVQFYSSGMVSRLAYAVAAHLHPDVLLVDEVLAVGDFDFQRKCIQHMRSYLAQGGALVLVSHSPHHIQAVCQRGLVLEKGRLAFAGSATEALDYYLAQQHTRPGGPDAAAPGTAASARPAAAPLSAARPVAIRALQACHAQSGGPPLTGHDLEVALTYEALAEVPGAGWSVFFWTADGTTCITGVYTLEPRTLAAGQHTLRCRLPRLPLAAGSYGLRAVISHLESLQPLAMLGWDDAPLRLEVDGPPSLEKNVQSMLRQLVNVEVEWLN